jgi:hypothetical protein
MWICTVPKVITTSCIRSLVDSVLEILNMFWNLLKKPTLCLINRYVKNIKYRFSEKCKNYFWEWRFGNGDADALEREGNIPLREILFSSVCLYVFFCLSFSFIFVCVSVRSLEIRFVLLLMGRTKILNLGDSDCHTALLERNVCFLSICTFVSYLFIFFS